MAIGSTEQRPLPSFSSQALMFLATACAMLGIFYVYDSIGPVAELLASQRGFSDTQIGLLNAVYNLPNVLMPLMGGFLIDRNGAPRVACYSAAICLCGAVLTAIGGPYWVMVLGRLLFGLGAETLPLAVIVSLAQWFAGRYFALLFALDVGLARLGSFLADRSPSFAHSLYERGWQAPLWLATGFAALALTSTVVYWIVDHRAAERGTVAIASRHERVDWHDLLRFRANYWYTIGLCVTFYSVITPFRSTFAIKYFQHAHGLALPEASRINSYIFLVAIFATPLFGLLVDRIGRPALLLFIGALSLPISFMFFAGGVETLWIPASLLGVGFSLVPAVLWPSVARHVAANHLGTAYGLMAMLQNTGILLANVIVGRLNDRNAAGAANAAGYDDMLWFFGLLSLAGVLFAILLGRRERAARVNLPHERGVV